MTTSSCKIILNCASIAQKYMLEMIAARRSSEKKEERFDLFTGLLDASDQDADGSAKLTDMELLGECPGR